MKGHVLEGNSGGASDSKKWGVVNWEKQVETYQRRGRGEVEEMRGKRRGKEVGIRGRGKEWRWKKI